MIRQSSVGSNPVAPPRLTGVLNSLVDPTQSLPAVVMSPVNTARASAFREAAREELDLIQKQLEFEIHSERIKLSRN